MKQLKSLPSQLDCQNRGAGSVSTRAIEARNKAIIDGVDAGRKDDRNRRGFRLECECGGRGVRKDHLRLPANQFGRQGRHLIDAFGPPVFDPHVLAVDIAGFLEALKELRRRRGVLR
jgi:hypothetical protein